MATTSVIPFTGIKRQYLSIRQEILDTIDRVYSSGQVLDGFHTTKFESAIAQMCGRQFAVAVNSGTQALVFAQMAMGIYDSKVLIPTQSFVATLNSVIMAGNTPRFVDIDANGLMDIHLPGVNSTLMKSNVQAIMYVNLYGNVLDYEKLRVATDFFNPETDIKIIEDAAQSLGASRNGRPSGSLGDISILSFDPTKNLPNYGSGGMVLTDDAIAFANLKDLRDNGKYLEHVSEGTNSKMSEADAACMLVKLKYFEEWQRRRTAIAEYYTEELKDIEYLTTPSADPGVIHAWHKYVIHTSDRDLLKARLAVRDIETKVHYDRPLPEYDVAFDHTNYAFDLFSVAREHARTALSLPIYPELTDSEVEYVAKTTRECIDSKNSS